MLTLGVYRAASEHAAVVVNDGMVVSAVHAPGSGERTGSADGVGRALGLAGVSLADVSVFSTSANAMEPTAQVVAPRLAQAMQVRATAPESRVAVVLEDAADGCASLVDLTTREVRVLDDVTALLRIAQSVAGAVGVECDHAIAALEFIALPEPCLTETQAVLNRLVARGLSPADVAASRHVEVQRLRAQAATSALDALASAVVSILEKTTAHTSGAVAGIAGSMCASSEFVTRLRRRINLVVAPAPYRFGEALGAALVPHSDVRPLTHLALGSSFNENEIKTALEKCRLDYVYEPDWGRLHTRVSELLATGALVGWCQGRADFSRQSFGSRSILCDPSQRYSRENVNVFLLNRDVSTPLPISLERPVAAAAPDTLQPLAFATTTPDPAVTQKLAAAIDRHGAIKCHVASAQAAPEFHALLRTHRERTQVPGLLHVPMLSSDVLAPTPRDAIRETYGSATDALVIGRFLIAKDYWLLRGRGVGMVSG